MSEKIVLIDGHSILNRAFYGVPLLSNSNGLHTNAVYGFLNILFKDGVILCTTAISQTSFSLDKSSEKLWEEYILKFFKKNNIGIQITE